MNALALLCGNAPGNLDLAVPDGELPRLPKFPSTVAPIDLFSLRPELRAAQMRAQAAEYQLASTIAERFPRLTLGLSYDFSTQQIETLFSDEVGRIASNLVLPVIDGGRRRAQVRQQEHVAKRLLLEYSENFLIALKEVDDALSRERNQKKVLKRVDAQVRHARNTLRESQARYLSGLGDYLPVLVAIQALQEIERRQISEKRAVLVARARLYRALGGYWMKTSAQAFENREQQQSMSSKADSNEGDPS
jgi:outer membrane protein TolC